MRRSRHRREWPGAGNTGSRPRIALFGIFGVGNFGNEASLEAMVRQLRNRVPEADLCCICTGPAQVARDHGLRTVGIRTPDPAFHHPLVRHVKRRLTGIAWRLGLLHATRLLRALWHTRKLDVLLFPGTGILDDFATDPWMWPADLLIWSAAARLNGVKMMAVSIGAGPINHPLSRCFLMIAARLWDYRSYRNDSSREFMHDLKFPVEPDGVYPDLVFSLPLDPRPRERKAAAHRPTVAVGLMSYQGWTNDPDQGRQIYERYIEQIAAFVSWLMTQQYPVRLAIGESCDEQAVEDVLRITRQAAGLHGPPMAVPISSFAQLMQALEPADIVVASRFHNVVCALMLGKPTISLGYSTKNSQLMEEFGLGAYCQHIEHFDLSALQTHLTELISRPPVDQAHVMAKSAECRARLEHQYAVISELVHAWMAANNYSSTAQPHPSIREDPRNPSCVSDLARRI